MAILLITFFAAAFIGVGIIGNETVSYAIMLGVYFIVLVIATSCDVRRLHDMGKNWKFIIWNLIPFGIFYYVFVVAFKKGDNDSNSYGAVPTYRKTWAMLMND